jgi:hypothetical protein
MPRTPQGRYLGCDRDFYDPRDHIWQPGSHLLQMAGPAPTSLDVHVGLDMPDLFDQINENSCTANAGTRWFSWLSLKFPQFTIPLVPLSRQGLYSCERIMEGDLDRDEGSTSRAIFKVLKDTGIAPETYDPYGPATLFQPPSQQYLAEAAKRRIGAYHRIATVDDLKGCLISGYAWTIGMALYESFEDVGPNGFYNPNPARERVIGQHEMYGHGLEENINGGSFKVDNSWGPKWGQQGSCYVSYAVLENYAISRWDGWVGHFGAPWKPRTQ